HISNNYQKWACSFPSLRGNNTLIIPIPKPGADLDFKNISQFTNNAPEEQQQALWQEVAEKLTEELAESNAPRWLNTEGTGVPYLHFPTEKSEIRPCVERSSALTYLPTITIIMTRTLSIAIKENTYQELKQKVGLGKISSFVNQAVEKELFELAQEEKRGKEQLRQQLIKDYQAQAKNKKLQKELKAMEETQFEDLNNEQKIRQKQ
ncbi:392_t:CDS:2, partial [Ambispora leptoticha]